MRKGVYTVKFYHHVTSPERISVPKNDREGTDDHRRSREEGTSEEGTLEEGTLEGVGRSKSNLCRGSLFGARRPGRNMRRRETETEDPQATGTPVGPGSRVYPTYFLNCKERVEGSGRRQGCDEDSVSFLVLF